MRALPKEFISGQVADFFGGRYRFTPSRMYGPPILANAKIWLDASVVSSIAVSGADVTSWSSLVNGYVGNTTTWITTKPKYGGAGARTINGVVVPEWTGVARQGVYFTQFSRTDQTETLYAVVLADSLAAYRPVVGPSGDGGNNYGCGFNGVARPQYIREDGNTHGSQYSQNDSCGLLPTGTPFVISCRFNGSSVTLGYNKAWETDSPGTTNSQTDEQYTYIGMSNYWRQHTGWDGLIAEMLIYDAVHTDTEMTYVTQNLMDKWGIA